MKILALGAHPDDLEILAYGSLMAWRAMGAELVLCVATDGAAGGAGDAAALARTRREEALAGAAALGTEPRFLDFPDGALYADRELDHALRKLIRAEVPDLVVTHAPEDYHADHRALSSAVSQAVNFSAPLLFMDTLGGTGFVPTHYVETTPHIAAKRAAILAHRSQDPERFVDSSERQSAFRAGECNGPPGAHAEAFRFQPRFPFADIRALLPPAPPLRPVAHRR